MTRSETMGADVTALLKARHTLLWVVTREEVRVERALTEASARAKFAVQFWDCATGTSDSSGKSVNNSEQIRDPGQILRKIQTSPERLVYILRDFHKWLGDPILLRTLRSLARSLEVAPPAEARAIVLLTTSAEVPPELSGHATVLDWPLPDRPEIKAILETAIETVREDKREAARPDSLDAAIDSAVGLTAQEAMNCYSLSLVTQKKIDPKIVSSEKKRVIAREKVLTWYDPDPRGLDAIGGLDLLKAWLVKRRSAFGQRARERGCPPPKGAFLAGLPGCGKSLTAKAVAAAYGVPLLRLDLGALSSKFVGESEANIRKALATAEAVSPCIVWIDEIEKALAGASGSAGDGGVAADKLGTLLSWMQDRQGSVFVIVTANDVRALPPELMRKGRFDELWWVDLPSTKDRAQIVRAALAEAKGRATDWLSDDIDADVVARATPGFSGAEIAAIVPDALYAAFDDGERALRTQDLVDAAKSVVPLGETAKAKIEELREWAKGRARYASTPEVASSGDGRALDME